MGLLPIKPAGVLLSYTGPDIVCATGVFHWWPRSKKDLQVHRESHPAMIGAGCPVLPRRAGAGGLFQSLSSAGVPLFSLPGGVLPLPSR